MKKVILIFLAIVSFNLKSQTIDSIRISNVGLITTIDTVYLKIYTTNDDGGYLTSTSYSVSGTNIYVLVNTCSGPSLILAPLNVFVKINPLNFGNHKIKVRIKDYDNFLSPGCNVLKYSTQDSININVVLPNSIKENSNVFTFANSIPNPFQNSIKLKIPGINECNLGIFDNFGRMVFEKNKYNSEHEIDLSFLSEGVYFLKIQNNNAQKVFKIIKTN